MGAYQSSDSAAHPADLPAGTAASPNKLASPTTVEMTDGRILSYDSYVQDSVGRFMPVRSTRKSKARISITPHPQRKSSISLHSHFPGRCRDLTVRSPSSAWNRKEIAV